MRTAERESRERAERERLTFKEETTRNPKNTAQNKSCSYHKAGGGVSLEEHNPRKTPEFLFQGPLDQALAHVERRRREEEEEEEGGG